jgi:hypothetical protein
MYEILPKGNRSLTRVVGKLASLPKDRAWKIEISEHKSTRSNEQNAFLWGVVYETIAQHLPGWDANDIHEYFLGEHFGWQTLEGLGRKRLKPRKRSSRLTTIQFNKYIEFIQRRMAEHGVYIPDPNEKRHAA